MSSGFNTFLANAEHIANEHQLKIDAIAEKNLEKFKIAYDTIKTSPQNKFSCHIQINIDMAQRESILLIKNFLTKEEKWPDNKVSLNLINNSQITADLYLTGVRMYS